MNRESNNGPLAFHEGTEERLLKYVQDNAKKGDLQSAIDTVDKFCWEEHWMMNLGDEKAQVYRNALKDSFSKSCLEFGCYVGYSALVALDAMGDESIVYFIDPNSHTNDIAKAIFEHAGVADRVHVLTGTLNTVYHALVGRKFDAFFLDHHKPSYLPDFKTVEKLDLLKEGSVVVADNVVIFKIDDLMDYIKESDNYKDCTLTHTNLEYSKDSDQKKDGVFVAVRV